LFSGQDNFSLQDANDRKVIKPLKNKAFLNIACDSAACQRKFLAHLRVPLVPKIPATITKKKPRTNSPGALLN